MVDVFVSYPRAERKKVEPIKRELDSLGLDTFFDIENIDAGAQYSAVLDKAVKAAKAVLGCWSPLAFTRSWVMLECGVGLARNVLVPIAIERFETLAIPVEFSKTNYFNLVDWSVAEPHEDWQRTLRAIGKLVGRDSLTQQVRSRVSTNVASTTHERIAVMADLRATWSAFPAKGETKAVENFLARVHAVAPLSGLEFEVEYKLEELRRTRPKGSPPPAAPRRLRQLPPAPKEYPPIYAIGGDPVPHFRPSEAALAASAAARRHFMEEKELPQSSLEQLTILDLSPRGVPRDLQAAANVFSNVRKLLSLKNLARLNIAETAVADVSALHALPNLEQLDISRTRVTDLRPLRDFPRLREVTLDDLGKPDDPIDLSPLAELKTLEVLNLWNAETTNLAAVCHRRRMGRIRLDDPTDGEIAALKSLSSLDTLVVGFSRSRGFDDVDYDDQDEPRSKPFETMRPLDWINAIPGLRSLRVAGAPTLNWIRRPGIIGKLLSNLAHFELGGISDLSPLSRLPRLRSLTVYLALFNGTLDFSSLRGVKQLRQLAIEDHGWIFERHDIDWLAATAKLDFIEEMRLHGGFDLSTIATMRGLVSLDVARSSATDLYPLQGLTKLKRLALRGVQVTSLLPLKRIQTLEELIIEDCPIDDLSPVSHIANVVVQGKPRDAASTGAAS